MKIVSVLVFTVALIASWYVSRTELPVAESVHMGIQSDLKRIIGEYVQKNLPQAKNLIFKKFWTETVKKNTVKASFLYSFDDTSSENGEARTEIEGYAILNKIRETSESVEWSFDELYILNNDVEFQEPIKITVGPGEEPAEAPAPEAGTETKETPGKKSEH